MVEKCSRPTHTCTACLCGERTKTSHEVHLPEYKGWMSRIRSFERRSRDTREYRLHIITTHNDVKRHSPPNIQYQQEDKRKTTRDHLDTRFRNIKDIHVYIRKPMHEIQHTARNSNHIIISQVPRDESVASRACKSSGGNKRSTIKATKNTENNGRH